MSKKVKVDNLAKEILQTMEEFADFTEEAVDKGVSETAKEAVEELRNAHPSGSGQYGSWDESYNKGWKVMQTKTDKRYHKKATIHNATDYQLTHLLEKGHALRSGGRTRAFPHIAPVAEKCEDQLIKNIKKWV
jgi:hypothetical protein